jgi:hypothetical protein
MVNNNPVLNLLLSFGPSETALLDWLRPHIDDSFLDEIAAADYGFEWEEHFQALKSIYEQQPIPVPLQWVPREVLNLMRWSEPDDPQYLSPPPNSKGRRGHLIRTFCCAVLLQAADNPETLGYIHAENETLVQLVASVLSLGHEASECALHFLCWRVLRLSEEENETPFFGLALLLLCAALFTPTQDGADLSLLADWVLAEETRVRRRPMAGSKSEEWLLGLTYHDQRHEVWRRLAQEVLLDPIKSFPETAATALGRIAKSLVPVRN